MNHSSPSSPIHHAPWLEGLESSNIHVASPYATASRLRVSIEKRHHKCKKGETGYLMNSVKNSTFNLVRLDPGAKTNHGFQE